MEHGALSINGKIEHGAWIEIQLNMLYLPNNRLYEKTTFHPVLILNNR